MSLVSLCSRRALFSQSFTRSVTSLAQPQLVTNPADVITTPEAFLSAIGRSSDTKLTVESWDELFNKSGSDLKKAGLGVKDRRYILWCISKYRQGELIRDFAHEERPKKTVRGWGPKVQNGKRIRSKRIKD